MGGIVFETFLGNEYEVVRIGDRSSGNVVSKVAGILHGWVEACDWQNLPSINENTPIVALSEEIKYQLRGSGAVSFLCLNQKCRPLFRDETIRTRECFKFVT